MALHQTTFLFVGLKKNSECCIVKETLESRRALWRIQQCGKQESITFKENALLKKIKTMFLWRRKDGLWYVIVFSTVF